MKFNDLGISQELNAQLEREGIIEPTKVQKQAIPLILEGHDVLVQSETGSGKTIGFAVPVIEQLTRKSEVQALVITPTRELARQVSDEFKRFMINDIKTTVVYGGVSINPQINRVKQSDVVVGTPGRLLDLLNRGALDLKACEYLILDEADRMLDMGFIDDIKRIIKEMPNKKQGLLFSATINDRIADVSNRFLKEPKKIHLENVIERGILKQYYYDVDDKKKLSLLVKLLKNKDRELSIVFCNTKHSTRFVANTLKVNGVKAESMNGDLSQHAREQILDKFSKQQLKVLVATDVAARGLDIDNITHVFNFDVPNNPENYTHRIGRTARNGEKGTAITILSGRDHDNMRRVEREYDGNIERAETPRLPWIELPKRKKRNFKKRRRHHRH